MLHGNVIIKRYANGLWESPIPVHTIRLDLQNKGISD